jgi:hypothetical protein
MLSLMFTSRIFSITECLVFLLIRKRFKQNMNKTGRALPVNTLSFFSTDFADNWSRLNKGDINVWAPFRKVTHCMMYKKVSSCATCCTYCHCDRDTITMMRKSISYKHSYNSVFYIKNYLTIPQIPPPPR